MISFLTNRLLYTEPIQYEDVEGKKYKIQFATEISQELQSKVLGIFSSTNAKEEGLFKKKISGNNIYFEKLCLFPCISIYEFTEIIALCLGYHPYQIGVKFEDSESSQILDFAHDDTYKKYTSIGFNKISIKITASNLPPLTFYENSFYKNYIEIASYVSNIIKNTSKQKVNSINLFPNISSISIILMYAGSHTSLDITRLFNMHTVGGRYSKIYIQSARLDANEMNEREMQYVKTSDDVSNPFNGVNSLYETCSMYIGEEISSGITLSSVDVCTNCLVKINFTIITANISYEDIKSVLVKWIKENKTNFLKELYLEDCVYDLNYDVSLYEATFGDISSSVVLAKGDINDIGEINILMNQDIPTMKFPTKTSIQFSMYAFESSCLNYKYKYLLINKDALTDNAIQRGFLPVCHAGLNLSTGMIAVSSQHASSFDESLYHYSMIIGLFSNLDKYSKTEQSKSPNTLASIQKRAKAINKKQLLKILYLTDPVLFGERNVGRTKRPYSGLAQKQEQRVVPITESEYEIVRKTAPQSVSNLQNQTFKAQRLYLYCPYAETSYINFHSIPNQMCIPRCTTKLSNRAQLNFCIKSLDINDMEITEGAENQSITLYNPIISRGRKCKLPMELNAIFPNCLCVKLNVNLEDVDKYYSDEYGKRAFIIRRNAEIEKYEIWTEYNNKEDYIFTLFAERTENDVFMVTDGKNPLTFSNNELLRNFFANNVIKTSAQLKFFNFVESVTGKQLNNIYNLGINDIIKYMHSKMNIQLATSLNVIFGIIYNNSLIFSPSFYWDNKDNENFVQLSEITESFKKNKLSLPYLNIFNKDYIDKLYIDYASKSVRGLEYKGVFTFTAASSVPMALNTLPKIQFDFNAAFRSILLNSGNEEIRTEGSESREKYIRILNYMYLFVYFIMKNMHSKSESDDVLRAKDSKDTNKRVFKKDEFMAFLTDNKFINENNNVVFISDNKKSISWRKSTLSKEKVEAFIDEQAFVDDYAISSIIYQQLQDSIKISLSPNEKIYKKIIT